LPVRAAQLRRSVAKEPENKKRDAKTQTSTTTGSGGRSTDKKATPVAKPTKRPSASKHIRRVSDDLPMKVEPISPGSGRPDQEDEVDDSDAGEMTVYCRSPFADLRSTRNGVIPADERQGVCVRPGEGWDMGSRRIPRKVKACWGVYALDPPPAPAIPPLSKRGRAVPFGCHALN